MEKLSTLLVTVKTKEAELIRAIDIRDEVIQKRFSLDEWEKEKRTAKQLESKKKAFLADRKKRIKDITEKIGILKEQLLDLKHKINRKNVSMALDRDILEVKWLRIELAKLMKLKERSMFGLDSEDLEELGIQEIIKKLEERKKKVDATIQEANHNTSL